MAIEVSMDVEFREARPKDYERISDEAAELFSSGRIKIWVAVHAAGEVGHCEGDSETGEILGLSVIPSHRRQGIGKRLLSLVVERLRAAGAKRIWLDAPSIPASPAYAFYRALGWRPTGERTGDDTYPGEILELPRIGHPPAQPR
jgi:ribosomal protein S18 acetylase RimI-like enzyme